MNTIEIENKLQSQDYIEAEMIETAFDFWFNDSKHIRSPFPFYIREKLRFSAIEKFLDWSSKISVKAKKDINDEILAEKFEEIIFESALGMVLTEDEKLTIRYPFMVRIGDIIKQKDISTENAESIITDRWFVKKGDFAFMKVKLKNNSSAEIWETEFELPE